MYQSFPIWIAVSMFFSLSVGNGFSLSISCCHLNPHLTCSFICSFIYSSHSHAVYTCCRLNMVLGYKTHVFLLRTTHLSWHKVNGLQTCVKQLTVAERSLVPALSYWIRPVLRSSDFGARIPGLRPQLSQLLAIVGPHLSGPHLLISKTAITEVPIS